MRRQKRVEAAAARGGHTAQAGADPVRGIDGKRGATVDCRRQPALPVAERSVAIDAKAKGRASRQAQEAGDEPAGRLIENTGQTQSVLRRCIDEVGGGLRRGHIRPAGANLGGDAFAHCLARAGQREANVAAGQSCAEIDGGKIE